MKKIEIKDIKKKYNDGLIKTSVLDNFDIFSNYQKNMINNWKNYEKVKEFNCLYQERIEEFKKIFGEQNFIWSGEFKMYSWVVKHNGCEAIIFSGKGKGTIVEIILNDNNRPKGSVEEFFNEYKNLMKKF